MLLLQLPSSFESAAAGGGAAAAAARLLALLKERPYCLQVPAEERGNPQAIALLAVAGKHCWRRCWPPASLLARPSARVPVYCTQLCCLHARPHRSTCIPIPPTACD